MALGVVASHPGRLPEASPFRALPNPSTASFRNCMHETCGKGTGAYRQKLSSYFSWRTRERIPVTGNHLCCSALTRSPPPPPAPGRSALRAQTQRFSPGEEEQQRLRAALRASSVPAGRRSCRESHGAVRAGMSPPAEDGTPLRGRLRGVGANGPAATSQPGAQVGGWVRPSGAAVLWSHSGELHERLLNTAARPELLQPLFKLTCLL